MTEHQNGSSAIKPIDRLKSETTDLLGAFGDRAFDSLRDRVEDATERLTGYATGNGSPGMKAAVKGAKGLAEGKSPLGSMVGAGMTALKEKVSGMADKGGGGKGKKITNIIESIDVGVPISVAYNQWTQFTDFPSFMKKVESVEQAEDETLNWKAQVLWSHRTWEATILEQEPDDKIIWRSKGAKGYVDGAVTFHELAPSLTRILVVLEYHPQGFFEHTGNLWRAQGRRVRLELKNFRRHVMSEALLHPEEVEGWRGTISDGEVQRQDDSSGGKKQPDGRGGSSKSPRQSSGSDTENADAPKNGRRGRQAAASGNGQGRARQPARKSEGGTASRGSTSSRPAGRAAKSGTASKPGSGSSGRSGGSGSRPGQSGARSSRSSSR